MILLFYNKICQKSRLYSRIAWNVIIIGCCSMGTDKKYSEYFGFTEQEVIQMMSYYEAESRFSTMKESMECD